MSGPDGGGRASIAGSHDLVQVRALIREFAEELGFRLSDTTRIVTASSELMRNVLEYAEEGEIRWRRADGRGGTGLEVEVEDQGPGIEDLDRALRKGTGTGRGFGMGLPGTRRLMDEMQVDSEPGRGTKVVIRKWLRSR